MSDSEHPDARRARRLAEARALRHSPERLAEAAELLRRKAEREAAEEAARPASSPRSSAAGTRTRSTTPRAPRAPKAPTAPPGVFGHPVAEWTAMRDVALERIGVAAAEHRFLTPDELWAEVAAAIGKDLGDLRFKVPRLLADVAAKAAEELRFLPTAIVVPSERVGPGRPFFKVAKDLDLLPGSLFIPISDEGWVMSPDLRDHWRSQVDATFEHFATDPDEG